MKDIDFSKIEYLGVRKKFGQEKVEYLDFLIRPNDLILYQITNKGFPPIGRFVEKCLGDGDIGQKGIVFTFMGRKKISGNIKPIFKDDYMPEGVAL